jgi:hypothetical protein
MTSVSKIASKNVHGSDHEGIISLLKSVLSHFPINIPSTECKKKPYKRCTVGIIPLVLDVVTTRPYKREKFSPGTY